MALMTAVLVLLAAVVASSIIARALAPLAPVPFVQMALGGLIAATFPMHVAVDPEVFLLVFVAPLLFLDGWRIPREGLFRDRGAIGALAFGLVFFTVLGAGAFIHWLAPAIPLPVGFALAAVLSPTDAVAVSAITARTPLPKRLTHILEGEALLNDASGLVCMRFAIAAALAGSVSAIDISVTFVWMVVGGVAIGALVALGANALKDWVASRFGEETGSQILISLLIPFAAYLLAARLQASGILAAVAAGVAMSHEERTGRALPATRIRRAAVWDAVQFAGNGVIFVLLGHELPGIVAGAARAVRQTGHQQGIWLLAYVLLVSVALLALRTLWVWATLRLSLLRRPRRGRRRRGTWRVVAVMSVAGVRGAVGLSAVMAFPLTLLDGAPFPGRDLAIFLAAGVILVSLVLANVGLPLLAADLALPPEPAHHAQEQNARLAAAQAAIGALEEDLAAATRDGQDAELYIQVRTRILEQYRARIGRRRAATHDSDLERRVDAIERRLRLIGLRAERDAFYRIARSGRLNDDLTRSLVREVDLLESRLVAR